YGIKPVPLVWLYDERFVTFLDEILWKVPEELGLSPAMAHGGGQFHFSAKTFVTGSLLCDDIAYKLNHPELSTWIMDFPEPDDRLFRPTGKRKAFFKKFIEYYGAGRFHPAAIGVLTPENAYHDRGFGPACSVPSSELMDPRRGPIGNPRDIF